MKLGVFSEDEVKVFHFHSCGPPLSGSGSSTSFGSSPDIRQSEAEGGGVLALKAAQLTRGERNLNPKQLRRRAAAGNSHRHTPAAVAGQRGASPEPRVRNLRSGSSRSGAASSQFALFFLEAAHLLRT